MTPTFDIVTLFPEYFNSCFSASLLGKAIEKKIIQVHLHHLRNYAVNAYGKVDDAPYGGGSGMLLMVEPIAKAVKFIESKRDTHIVLLSARGKLTKQSDIKSLYKKFFEHKSITFICGHYEGIDERVAEHIAHESLRVGDYVLSGGEPAAAMLVDSIARLHPGFMTNRQSLAEESFKQEGYIEYPQYTRPETFQGWRVPQILLSGNHQKIKEWQQKNSLFSNDQNKVKP